MIYCIKCGSELRGAKNFCLVCGSKQEKLGKEKSGPRPEKKEKQVKKVETGTCIKCGEDTERTCFFCDDFICRDDYKRMQANKYPYEEFVSLKAQGEKRLINEGWRGFIIFACPKCSGKKYTKGLTPGERDAINVVDQCSWIKLD